MTQKEIITEWTRRLRSGEYKQGRGALHFEDEFCCLGVLCEVAVEQKVINKPTNGLLDDRVQYYDGESEVLPIAVRNWVGAKNCVCSYGPPPSDCLTDANDRGKSFSEIADIIELHSSVIFNDINKEVVCES